MILLWMYLIGYVWFWRYHVGYFLDDDFVYGKIDGGDVGFALAFGTMTTLFWPCTVTGRMVQRTWVSSFGDTSADAIRTFFPEPKEIETQRERRERKAREAQTQITKRRQEINQHERENDLELTRWSE